MTARTPATLKTNMPSGVTGGTTIADMHDFIDTVSARTAFSVKEFGAVGTEIASSDSAGRNARAIIDTQAFLDATAAAAAGVSSVYVPAGHYYISANTWILPSGMKIQGDGTSSRINKRGSGWLLDASGFGDWVLDTQTRNSGVILRDLYFHGNDNSGAIFRTYYSSEVLIDKCKFANNSGPAIDGVEWWDSRIMNCFFDWCGTSNTENPVIYLRNAISVTDTNVFGYSRDSTNAIYIYGCRIESFPGHAIKFNSTEAMGTDALSQIFITNCKLETHFLGASLLKFSANNVQQNIHIDTLFISVNNFTSGYTTATDLIDWTVNNGCSIRNVWVWIADPTSGVSPLVRAVVRSNCSFNSNTIENVFANGVKPSLAVLEANGNTDPQLMGFIGGISSAVNAQAIVEHAGKYRVITSSPTVLQSHDGSTYTNATSANIDVSIPANVYPGWTVRALQLHALGTITFVGAAGVTFQTENGAEHRRTAGLNTMMTLTVTSNTDLATAAVCHVSGKTAPAT